MNLLDINIENNLQYLQQGVNEKGGQRTALTFCVWGWCWCWVVGCSGDGDLSSVPGPGSERVCGAKDDE